MNIKKNRTIGIRTDENFIKLFGNRLRDLQHIEVRNPEKRRHAVLRSECDTTQKCNWSFASLHLKTFENQTDRNLIPFGVWFFCTSRKPNQNDALTLSMCFFYEPFQFWFLRWRMGMWIVTDNTVLVACHSVSDLFRT